MSAIVRIGLTAGDQLRRTLSVYIADETAHGYEYVQPDGTVLSIRTDDSAALDLEPSLTLREEHARALLDALITHFNGGENTRQLRKDYDAERARVDRLLDALVKPVGGIFPTPQEQR